MVPIKSGRLRFQFVRESRQSQYKDVLPYHCYGFSLVTANWSGLVSQRYIIDQFRLYSWVVVLLLLLLLLCTMQEVKWRAERVVCRQSAMVRSLEVSRPTGANFRSSSPWNLLVGNNCAVRLF